MLGKFRRLGQGAEIEDQGHRAITQDSGARYSFNILVDTTQRLGMGKGIINRV